jgi:hypothetical protein
MLPVTRYDNLGVPERAGCGAGSGALPMPRAADLEIALSDDLLNQLLYAGWRGGLLEFPLTVPEAGGGLAENLEVTISGMLAPTASDCGDGQLVAHIGDIQIDATLDLLGEPVTFRAYSSMRVLLQIVQGEDGIAIDLARVLDVQTELTANDDAIMNEMLLATALEGELTDQLLGQLGGGGLGSITLPQIDLSATLGLPAGTAVLQIHVDTVEHQPGQTLVSGSF